MSSASFHLFSASASGQRSSAAASRFFSPRFLIATTTNTSVPGTCSHFSTSTSLFRSTTGYTLPIPSTLYMVGQDNLRYCCRSNQRVLAPLVTQKAYLFTNAKKSFARGTEEELKAREEAEKKASQEFLKREVHGDGRNVPRLRDVEDFLPSKKQLNEELPSAAELEKALREGKMDMYAAKPEKDEE